MFDTTFVDRGGRAQSDLAFLFALLLARQLAGFLLAAFPVHWNAAFLFYQTGERHFDPFDRSHTRRHYPFGAGWL